MRFWTSVSSVFRATFLKSAVVSVVSVAFFAAGTLAVPSSSYAADTSTREFVMSCTYGVLAGTLVGAASLAFTKRPSKNMHRVARGASLGLYTGILLGLYVVYIVPGMEDSDDPVAVLKDRFPLQIAPAFRYADVGSDDIDASSIFNRGNRADNDIDGIQIDWVAWRF